MPGQSKHVLQSQISVHLPAPSLTNTGSNFSKALQLPRYSFTHRAVMNIKWNNVCKTVNAASMVGIEKYSDLFLPRWIQEACGRVLMQDVVPF